MMHSGLKGRLDIGDGFSGEFCDTNELLKLEHARRGGEESLHDKDIEGYYLPQVGRAKMQYGDYMMGMGYGVMGRKKSLEMKRTKQTARKTMTMNHLSYREAIIRAYKNFDIDFVSFELEMRIGMMIKNEMLTLIPPG
ncbi:Uncharacterized protein Fot_04071 [Forsythia ovata]|uniref:Uncharacterized protein n=1 Tax=Forsythia ovata TaxID=205694 RepID=A0ABD1XBI4_9LAMI